jgi:acyl-CoA thioesterase I
VSISLMMMKPLVGQMVRFALLVNIMLAATMVQATGLEARTVRIVALGDSLTAGYGLRAEQAFPVRLERLLKARGHDVQVANAGVSGDTTAGGLARLGWAVPEGTDAVVLELGANDALRALSPEKAKANLDAIITKLKARGIAVLLAGMRAPRNLGDDYANRFDRIFPELAAKHDVILYPFFLAGIALDPKLNLRDGIHPNAAGIDVIAERILPAVEELIGRVKASRQQTRG